MKHDSDFDEVLTSIAPANDVVEYETKVFLDNVVHLSPFQGEPNDEKDALWDDAYGSEFGLRRNRSSTDH